MTARRTVVLTALVVFFSVLMPERAEARRRGLPLLFIVNTGDAIYEVADLPPSLASDPQLDGWSLGWKCSHFGLLWADFRTWDRELVLYDGESGYADLPPEMRERLEIDHPFSDAQRGIWNRFGWIALVGAVGFGVFSRMS